MTKKFGEIRNDFKIAAPAGQGPDILIGAHDWIGELIASGLLAEVSLGDGREGFCARIRCRPTPYNGKLYGMPHAMENIAFFYNTDLVKTPPTTWDEVTSCPRRSRMPAPSMAT